MALTQIGLFPFLSVAFALLAFFIGYAIAVGKNHVDAWLPFISDCGCLPPESNVFGQLLNISCFFLALTVYFVHRNMVVFYEDVHLQKMGSWKVFSFLLMLLGWLATLGASMVANFQEGVQLTTHGIGAFTFFIGITLYFWGIVLMGSVLRPRMVPVGLTIFRAVIVTCISGLLVFHMICLFASPFVKTVNGKQPVKPPAPHNIERYEPSSPFYDNHLATTTSEWVLALLIELLVLTFTYDFACTVLHAPATAHNEQGDGKRAWGPEVVSLSQVAPSNVDSVLYQPTGSTQISSTPHEWNREKTEMGRDIRRFPRAQLRQRNETVTSYNQYEYY